MDYESDFEEDYFNHGVGKIHFKHHKGSTRTAIFIHGLASNMRTWIKLAKYLDPKLDIYLIDLLGHGESDAPDVEYSVKLNVEIVKSFIESQEIEKCTLYGHSYGGWIAANCAQSDKSIKGLILEDSAGLQGFVSDRVDADPSYKTDLIKKSLMLNPREHVVTSLVHADNTKYMLTEGKLKMINIPTLILWGAKDESIDVRYAKSFKRYLKDSTLEIIHDSGHTPHYTHPKEVAEILNRYLPKI